MRSLFLAIVIAVVSLRCGGATDADVEQLECPVGGDCSEVNECLADVTPCGEMATCIDGDNEAICYCDSQRGLFGDGMTCVERQVRYQCRCIGTCDKAVQTDERVDRCADTGMTRVIRQALDVCPKPEARPTGCAEWSCNCTCAQTTEPCS